MYSGGSTACLAAVAPSSALQAPNVTCGYTSGLPNRIATVTANNGTANVLTTTKTHDPRDRLLSISAAPSSALRVPRSMHAYTYDDASQRPKTTLADGSYPSSPAGCAGASWNLIAELAPKPPHPCSLTPTRTYAWGLDLSQTTQGAGGVGGLLAVTRHEAPGTKHTYYATDDANGNVSEYLGANGASVAHFEYSPFGRKTAATGTKAADFAHRFSTKYLDEHGLYYYGRRSYSPEMGRWVNRDPSGECKDKNLYGLGTNAPIAGTDPLGLSWADDFRRAGSECCPACELPGLRERLAQQQEILAVWLPGNQWLWEVIPGLEALGGITGCPPTGEPNIVFKDALKLESCFGKCVALHEGVHRDQCMNHRDDYWWDAYKVEVEATADIEIPAYEKGVSCLKNFIRFGEALTRRYGSREKACLCCLKQKHKNSNQYEGDFPGWIERLF